MQWTALAEVYDCHPLVMGAVLQAPLQNLSEPV